MRKRTTLLAALLALALLPACGQGSGPEPQVQEPPTQEEMQRETLRLELTRSAADEDTLMQALHGGEYICNFAMGAKVDGVIDAVLKSVKSGQWEQC